MASSVSKSTYVPFPEGTEGRVIEFRSNVLSLQKRLANGHFELLAAVNRLSRNARMPSK